MTAPETIRQLVTRFDEHRESYRSGKYNETQLRREFLDPFFEALGWDVFNKQGYAETYNLSNPAERTMHDKMVSLVDRMLALHKQPAAATPQEQEMVKREIVSTDRAIDKLVYELYGLSEDEIGIVEGK